METWMFAAIGLYCLAQLAILLGFLAARYSGPGWPEEEK